MSEQNKELWRQFAKVWDVGDTDSFGDFAAANAVDHTAPPGMSPGIEGMKALNLMLKAGFPDRSTEVHNVLAEGERIAALHTVRATHTGEFMGMPPTGKSFEVNAIHIARVADGKIAEHWGLLDQGRMLMQLGVMPMPPGTESWTPPPTRPQRTGDGAGNPDANRAEMDAMIDAMREGDLDAVLARIQPDTIDHSALPGQGPGREGVRWRFEQLFGGLTKPDFKPVASVGEGPYLAQAYTFTATHAGPLMGMPATNKSFQVNAIDFVRFEDGKFIEHWGVIDMPALLAQLGS